MTIGQRIKALRDALEWTQAELARQARVSPSYVSMLENGERANIGGERLARIARALGTTMEALQTGETPPDLSEPPLEMLRATGAPPGELDALARRWPHWDVRRRQTYLKLLRESYELAEQQMRLRALIEEAQTDSEGQPEVVGDVPHLGEQPAPARLQPKQATM